MKILIIDDKANYGWKQLITKMFPFQGISIDTALDYDSALNQIENKYDIIFLDVRLSAEDHDNKNVVEFSGFKILKVIKNFSIQIHLKIHDLLKYFLQLVPIGLINFVL